jgi:hypothetical protein
MGRDAAKEWTASTRTERVATGTTVDQPPVKGMWCEADVERTEEETTVTASVGDMGSIWRCWGRSFSAGKKSAPLRIGDAGRSFLWLKELPT